jgi:surface polysaccharide O-acyltransferase-like enzyme
MAFMIVGLHAGFLREFTSLGEYLTVDGVFRIAVPIFLIINGFYFYPVLIKNNHINWLKRVAILYVVWMVFYSYYWFEVPEFSFVSVAKFIKNIIIGYHHLWYISGMLGAALVLIILRKLSSSILTASILLAFICGVLIQYLGNYHVFEGTIIDTLFNFNWFHRNMLFFSFPFFCIGYLINKHSLQDAISFKVCCILSAFGLLALLGESYVNYYQEGRDGGFDNFLFLILVCPFVFILFMKSNISGSSKSIALYSSAIYFMHAFLLSVFRKYTHFDPTILTLINIIASIFCSYFIIKANTKLKFIL